MAAGNYDFTIEQGATVDFAVQYKDSGSNPVDLSGNQARMQHRPTFEKEEAEATYKYMLEDSFVTEYKKTEELEKNGVK